MSFLIKSVFTNRAKLRALTWKIAKARIKLTKNKWKFLTGGSIVLLTHFMYKHPEIPHRELIVAGAAYGLFFVENAIERKFTSDKIIQLFDILAEIKARAVEQQVF